MRTQPSMRKENILCICTWVVNNRNKRKSSSKRVDIQALNYKVVNIKSALVLISLEKYIPW